MKTRQGAIRARAIRRMTFGVTSTLETHVGGLQTRLGGILGDVATRDLGGRRAQGRSDIYSIEI